MTKFFQFLRKQWLKLIAAGLMLVVGIWGGRYLLIRYSHWSSDSNQYIQQWLVQPERRDDLRTTREQCEGAPFILPSEGFIGLLWNDPDAPYNMFNPHTGIDIFGDGAEGAVPVYAVYDGYLTRLLDWFSTVIIEHDDPLNAGQKIWSYYTHMAAGDESESFIAEDFPAGTTRQWVEQGTLLGYQGEYSNFPIALHVHMSLVKSDKEGKFTNEAVLSNTVDPSPYFGLPLNQTQHPARPIRCSGIISG